MEFIEIEKIKIDEGLRSLIPALQEDEFLHLRGNIEKEGITNPIVLWKSEDPAIHNTIVDGMHRLQVAKLLNHSTVPYRYITFESYSKVEEWMIYQQIGRRNLTTLQKADLGIILANLLHEEAQRRKQAGTKQEEGSVGEAMDQAGTIVGVSGDTILQATNIRKVPVVNQLVHEGKLPLSTGDKITKVKNPEFREFLLKKLDVTATSKQNNAIIQPILHKIRTENRVSDETDAEISKVSGLYPLNTEEAINATFEKFFHESIEVKWNPNFKIDPATQAAANKELKDQLMKAPSRIKAAMIQKDENSKPLAKPRDVFILVKEGKEFPENLTEIEKLAEKTRLDIARKDMDKKETQKLTKEENTIRTELELAEAARRMHQVDTLYIMLHHTLENIRNDVIYCPKHGVEAKCTFLGAQGFSCGLTAKEAEDLALANKYKLLPKQREVTITTEVTRTLVDGTTVKDKVPTTKKERVPGYVGRTYSEQVEEPYTPPELAEKQEEQ